MTTDPYPDLPGAELPARGPAHASERPELDEADSRLLEALTRPALPVVTAVEDALPARWAAGDEAAVPSRPPAGRRRLTPVFRAPD